MFSEFCWLEVVRPFISAYIFMKVLIMLLYRYLFAGEVHSPLAEATEKQHTMKSKFDSETESESEDESRAKGVPLSSVAKATGFSGYHDIVISGDEHSDVSDIEKERAEEKESMGLPRGNGR